MPSLLDWEHLRARISNALASGKTLSLVCDYDGTLSPIASEPGLAVPGQGIVSILRKLESCECVRTAVISGRTKPELERLLNGLKKTELIGDHGAVLRDPEHYRKQAAEFRGALDWLPLKFPGVILEDKDTAVGIHFRKVLPEAAPAMIGDFFDWWLEQGNLCAFQVVSGKMVLEIRPRVKTNKGTAVLGLLEQWYGEVWPVRTLPLYLGDDTTDEDAFAALHATAGRTHAATILVAEQDRPSAAHHRVPAVQDVRVLLESVLELCENSGRRIPQRPPLTVLKEE